jgi:hypothetical protein
MSKLKHGIVGNATLFKGVVGPSFKVFLVNPADNPISHAKCQIKLQNDQTMRIASDSEGVLKISGQITGEFDIQLLELNEESS